VGDTLLPVTVMAMVRPAVEVLEVPDAPEVLDEELDGDPVVVPTAGSSPDPPQAVRDTARASPAAYERGTRRVIFVTNPSLNSAF